MASVQSASTTTRAKRASLETAQIVLNTNEAALPSNHAGRPGHPRYTIDSKSYQCKTPVIRHRLTSNGQRSINEFYAGCMKSRPQPRSGTIVAKGMQNYSNVVLGDYRLAQETESVGMAMLEEVHDKLDSNADSDNCNDVFSQFNRMTVEARAMEYEVSRERVGESKLAIMERNMRDKLQQRTQSGPFQLRKNFHYFDQGNDGAISLKAFGRALEFMGFEMDHDEMVALFGLYDVDCSGTIEFYEFVDKLMEQDFSQISKSHMKVLKEMSDFAAVAGQEGVLPGDRSLDGSNSSRSMYSQSPDSVRQRELSHQEIHRVRRVFDLIDRSHDGCIDRREFMLLMASLGHQELTSQQLETAMNVIDTDHTGMIEFNEFLRWYQESSGSNSAGARTHT